VPTSSSSTSPDTPTQWRRLVAFGPHVDDRLLEGARADGADVVVPRSQFFRSPAAAVTGQI